MSILKTTALFVGILGLAVASTDAVHAQSWEDHTTSNNSTVTARHETGSVVHGNKLYVLGGRGNRPVQVFDAVQNKWSTLAPLPIELHHFQPVVVNGDLYVLGAFTCCYPAETNVSDIYKLDLGNNTWEVVGSIPNNRLRGAAGAVVRNNKIYLIGGNTNGHSGGAVGWFDEYNPATGAWTVLPDAPNARDHFSAAIVGNVLVAAAGRTTNLSFGGMVGATDTYNFNTGQWYSGQPIPTPRAGAVIGVENGNLIVMGGETDTQLKAHDEVEAYDVSANAWRSLPVLQSGRHGGAAGVINDTLHAITGNTYRGGGAEVTDHETLDLADSDNDGLFNFEDDTDTGTGTTVIPNATIDTDNDGLTDQKEASLRTDPQKADTDGDSLTDGDEVNKHKTDPLKKDSDADGLSDDDEINRRTDPLVKDTDTDGLLDAEEIQLGTNPLSKDSDTDGLSDIDEIQTYSTNPTNSDSDGDNLKDQDELQLYFTDPLLGDSDNDGLSDGAEILTHNSNPNNWDTDGDGISDATEAAQGTNLLANPDQDGDGISNADEGTGDPDGDTLPNYLDLDSDNDSIPDVVENGGVDSDNNGQKDTAAAVPDQLQNDATALLDSDGDGIANIFDLDSDQDGKSDLAESGHPDPENYGRLPVDQFIDADLNGWHDTIAALPMDTDGDTTPDYIDLDSNDNGTTDAIAYGGSDLDNDGKLDNFSDANGDGLHDEVTGISSVALDEDSDGIPDAIDMEIDTGEIVTETETETESKAMTTSSGGGCTIGNSNDPLLPTIMLTVLSFLAIRRRARLSNQGTH